MISGGKFKAIVIDDEFPSRLMIKQLAGNHADVIVLIGEAKSGSEGIAMINELVPDLIFLDINLRNMNGFELLSKIKAHPYVIFTTAYPEYALKAFETNCIDYLVKPIEEQRFDQAIKKLRQLKTAPPPYPQLEQVKESLLEFQPKQKASVIPIKIGNKFIFIRLNDVAYIEAREKYVYVNTISGSSHLSDTRLADFELILPSHFIRIQKSFIVNTDCISEVQKHFGNRLVFLLNDKAKSKVISGITYIADIREKLGL